MMENGRHYIVLRGETEAALETLVNRHVDEGWKLHGGVCVIVRGRSDLDFFQAMLREAQGE